MIIVGDLFSWLELKTPEDFKYDNSIQESLDFILKEQYNEDLLAVKKFIQYNVKDQKMLYFALLVKIIQDFYDESKLNTMIKQCVVDEFGEVLDMNNLNVGNIVGKVFYQKYKRELLKVLDVKKDVEGMIYKSLSE